MLSAFIIGVMTRMRQNDGFSGEWAVRATSGPLLMHAALTVVMENLGPMSDGRPISRRAQPPAWPAPRLPTVHYFRANAAMLRTTLMASDERLRLRLAGAR